MVVGVAVYLFERVEACDRVGGGGGGDGVSGGRGGGGGGGGGRQGGGGYEGCVAAGCAAAAATFGDGGGGTAEHLRDAGAGEGGRGGAVFGVDLLEGVEFGEEGVEAAEELGRGVGVEVDDGGERDAEEEVVCRAAAELAAVEVGHALEVGLVEEQRVEPVDAALVAARGWVSGVCWGQHVREKRESLRLAQILQRRYPLGGRLLYVLVYHGQLGRLGVIHAEHGRRPLDGVARHGRDGPAAQHLGEALGYRGAGNGFGGRRRAECGIEL